MLTRAYRQVPLPMPKDILPLLAKDAEKQKAIEEKAAQALEDAKKKPEPAVKPVPVPAQSRKISMKIPEIPPFKPKVSPQPPVLPVTESSAKDIPLSTSPTPSAASHVSGNTLQAKLNPNANSFVFKPNPASAAFKPGQPSSVISPSQQPAQLPVRSFSCNPESCLYPAVSCCWAFGTEGSEPLLPGAACTHERHRSEE